MAESPQSVHEAAKRYAEALRSAVAELIAARKKVAAARAAAAAAERQIAELAPLVDGLARKVPPDERRRILAPLQGASGPAKVRPDTGKPAYRALIKTLTSDPGRQWTIPDVQESLARVGFSLDNKIVGTNLARLAKAGGLVKVGRGIYRIPEYGIGLVDSADFDAFEGRGNCGD